MARPKITLKIDDRVLVKLIADTKGKGPVRIVADGVEYGLFQELGTSRMAAQPFMVPAVEAVRPGFVKAMKGQLTMTQVTAVVDKAAFDVERGAKQRAAVDTAAMKNSIHVVDGDEFGVTFAELSKGKAIA